MKKKRDTAICNICGAKVPPTEESMMTHLITRHPLSMLEHKSIASPLIAGAFSFGAAVAKALKGEK